MIKFLSCWITLIIVLFFISTSAMSQQINVKYHDGIVDLSNGQFHSYSLKYSSVVKEIFYNSSNRYLIVNLNGTYYQYCDIPSNVVDNWISAPSLGKFYIGRIKGEYDCRTYSSGASTSNETSNIVHGETAAIQSEVAPSDGTAHHGRSGTPLSPLLAIGLLSLIVLWLFR